ncbi:MAG: AfsA-related hotdog domain-containing protein [Proteobacteria bacterium]|nr:AfsA-related hotdog domain-containing protein [Pseudomonadota bacterium]
MQNLVITPKLLHKDSEDDVLLEHPRFALPLCIDEKTLQRWEQAGLDFLLELYLPHDRENDLLCLILPSGNQGLSSLFGRSIPEDSTWQRCRALPYQIVEDEFLESHAPLLKKLEHFQINTGEAKHLVPGLFRSSSYRMINQADHYFFYRKCHEHVPGIMLIEAQRQAIYAHIYATTQHVRGEVTISLGNLNSAFYGYVELMYPVELIVDEMKENWDPYRDVRPKKNTYRVSFFQRGKLVAIIDSEVDIIKLDQFKRLRSLFIYEKGDHWYTPIRANRMQCTLIDSKNSEHLVECMSVSRNGCVTTYNKAVIDNIRMITIKSNELIFSSTIELKNTSPRNATWKFSGLTQDQLSHMGEIIKRGFILQNDEVFQ